jgi:hypothetical protein
MKTKADESQHPREERYMADRRTDETSSLAYVRMKERDSEGRREGAPQKKVGVFWRMPKSRGRHRESNSGLLDPNEEFYLLTMAPLR